MNKVQRLEKALAEVKERNKNLMAANRRLKYKNNLLTEELQFAKEILLQNTSKKAKN